jgi:hypothetical protein
MLRDTNILRFQTNQPVTRPFVWLEGGFRVASRTPFSAGPGDTVKTNGPFVVRAGSGSLGPDLIGDGFPFLREPLAAVADVDFPCASVTAMLEGAEACAIRLTVDGCDLGWTWTRRIDAALGAGFHRLRVTSRTLPARRRQLISPPGISAVSACRRLFPWRRSQAAAETIFSDSMPRKA